MGKREEQLTKRRLRSSYITTVVSISLVLFMLGLTGLLVLNAKKLSDQEKKEVEKDVLEIVGDQKTGDEPIILDFESVRITGPGKYELDLVNLFKKDPVIFKLDDGKYVIDLPETFKKIGERKGVEMPDEKTSKKKK